MRLIYEKEQTVQIDGADVQEIVECAQKDATHLHICRHEEGQPCKRITL